MTIGQKIKQCRESKNMTQSDLARSIGVVRSAVSNWEKDIREPARKLLIPLAKIIGVDVRLLLENEDQRAS